MSGYPDGTFGGNNTITRQEVVVILYRYAKFKGVDMSHTDSGKWSGYTDTADLWAVEEMKWAVNTGLLNGRTAATLNPEDTAMRSEVAEFFKRFFEKYEKQLNGVI